MERYRVTAWHGECGSIFYVVDTQAPQDDQPAVVDSYTERYMAIRDRDALNMGLRAPMRYGDSK